MADITFVPRRCPPASAADRTLRLARQSNRGIMPDTRTGERTTDRRGLMDRAVRITNGETVAIIRKRLRYCWPLQDALATTVP